MAPLHLDKKQPRENECVENFGALRGNQSLEEADHFAVW